MGRKSVEKINIQNGKMREEGRINNQVELKLDEKAKNIKKKTLSIN
jgi:hypothetical protein